MHMALSMYSMFCTDEFLHPDSVMHKRLLGVCIALILSFECTTAYAQPVHISLGPDRESKPLMSDDNGITLEYTTESCGDLSAFLRAPQKTYGLFSGSREFAGKGEIRFSREKLAELCDLFADPMSPCVLVLTHVACRHSTYSETTLPIRITIDRPFGCHLTDSPSRPIVRPTNLRVHKTRPLGTLGVVCGAGILVAAVLHGARDDKKQQNQGYALAALGALVTSISADYASAWIPNEIANADNAEANRHALSEWKIESEIINRTNRLIIETYSVRFIPDG